VAQGDLVETELLSTDDEIIRATIECEPDLVSIDAPLTFPAGRRCHRDDCECRVHGISRESERILRRRGVSVYWCLVPSMQGLTCRGMAMAVRLREAGIPVIESYPGAAQDILGILRKRSSVEELRAGLADAGFRGDFLERMPSHDELDAITCSLVGYFYLAGSFEALGNAEEGYLIIPKALGGSRSRFTSDSTAAPKCILVVEEDGKASDMGLSSTPHTRERDYRELLRAHKGRGLDTPSHLDETEEGRAYSDGAVSAVVRRALLSGTSLVLRSVPGLDSALRLQQRLRPLATIARFDG
jgi:predicted nuclease with RNAse H fold